MAQATEIDVGAVIENEEVGWFRASIINLSCAVMFVDGYDLQVMSFAAPCIIRARQINKAYFGPVFGFGVLGYMLGAMLLSNLADRIGRKQIVIGGVLLFGVFSLATALATSVTALLVLRLVAGIGLGGSIPSVIALAVEYAPSRMRATIISVLFAGYTIGGAFGSLYGPSLRNLSHTINS
jgi:AAHS family 4-hydroxybenzoate transporter-like MFS transporter